MTVDDSVSGIMTTGRHRVRVLVGVTHGVENLHVGVGYLEVEFGVLSDVVGGSCLGQDDRAFSEQVADAQLWRADVVARCDIGDLGGCRG